MTLDIVFGVPVEQTEDGETYTRVEWEPEPQENDGTDPDLSITSGKPRRYISWGDVGRWLTDFPQWDALFDAMGWNGTNDYCHVPLNDDIMRLVKAVPVKGSRLERDRAIWLHYWARRAREILGDNAVIGLR